MKLKGRLAELKNCYSNERIIWDVGCDHGQLGLSFLDNERVKEIHLVDPSLDVIRKLESNNLLDSYITIGKLFIKHDRGQEIRIEKKESIVFIAGMGGKEIISILEHLESQSSCEFNCTISPHKNILELREYLQNSVYCLRDEFLVKDADRFYQVLSLDFSSDAKASPYGDLIWKSPYAHDYRSYLIDVYESHQEPKDQAYLRFLKSLTF